MCWGENEGKGKGKGEIRPHTHTYTHFHIQNCGGDGVRNKRMGIALKGGQGMMLSMIVGKSG